MATSFFRGHPTKTIDGKWCYADTGEIIADGDDESVPHNIRPCKKCGAVFGLHDPDPCLGMLPGVDFACCGHGIQDEAYIQYPTGLRLDDFTVTETDDRTICYQRTIFYYDGICVFEGRDILNRFYLGVVLDTDEDSDKYLVVEIDPATEVSEDLGNLRDVILNRPHEVWYLVWANDLNENLRLHGHRGEIPEEYLPEDESEK